jgi:predicted NBD/HSP70 family sugar kinase
MTLRIGIDLGGTKTEIIALDARGAVLERRREPTPPGDYAATIALIARMVKRAEAQVGERGTVGIGTPGSLSPATGLLRNSNSTAFNGKPLKQDLEQALGRTVRVANDANCFALSEARDGAGRGAAVVFGVILGTGVGGGVVVNGHVLEGINAIGGEWGHNPLPWPEDDERPGHACFCGRRGCNETFLSGTGLSRDYAAQGGKTLSAKEIVGLAATGDATAQKCLVRYETRLARALAAVINLLDPDVIVLGGGLSNIERLYTGVPQLWGQWIFSDAVRTRLVRNLHGDSSGVRGAAWLWETHRHSRENGNPSTS